MALRTWKKLTENTVFKNQWWTYKHDSFRLPSGQVREYHYVHTEGSSMVVPVQPDGRVVLVRQYRYLNDRDSLEFPCGGMKPGSTCEETAGVELQEEAGFRASQLLYVGAFNPYNGVTDEYCHIYIARGLQEARLHPDETEEFEIVVRTPQEVDQMIAQNEIWDGMTIAGWLLARNKL
jgi:ADP-ribose pyrophosphatase